MENNPLVSIIIVGKNSSRYAGKMAVSLINLSYGNKEIIYVDDHSDDNTLELMSKYPGIKVLKNNGFGPSCGRNMGIKEAKGAFIAFTDSDCIVEKNWIEELLKGFVNESAAGVGGDQKSPGDESEFGKGINGFLKSIGFVSDYIKTGSKLVKTPHNPTCNVMYKKDILIKMNGFREGLWPGVDIELDYRITKSGYELFYNPGAVVYHYRPGTLKKFVNMMLNYGSVQAYLVKQYGLFRFIHYFPLMSIIFIIFMLIYIELLANIAVLMLIMFYIFMVIRTKNILTSFRYTFYGILTFIFWHYGFFKLMLTGKRT